MLKKKLNFSLKYADISADIFPHSCFSFQKYSGGKCPFKGCFSVSDAWPQIKAFNYKRIPDGRLLSVTKMPDVLIMRAIIAYLIPAMNCKKIKKHATMFHCLWWDFFCRMPAYNLKNGRRTTKKLILTYTQRLRGTSGLCNG